MHIYLIFFPLKHSLSQAQAGINLEQCNLLSLLSAEITVKLY